MFWLEAAIMPKIELSPEIGRQLPVTFWRFSSSLRFVRSTPPPRKRSPTMNCRLARPARLLRLGLLVIWRVPSIVWSDWKPVMLSRSSSSKMRAPKTSVRALKPETSTSPLFSVCARVHQRQCQALDGGGWRDGGADAP